VALRYAEDTEWKAREAWRFGVVLADRSHWGRLRFSGKGRLDFLHAQSTQDLCHLDAGSLAQTVCFCLRTPRRKSTGQLIHKARPVSTCCRNNHEGTVNTTHCCRNKMLYVECHTSPPIKSCPTGQATSAGCPIVVVIRADT
jgi:hypothetical protein